MCCCLSGEPIESKNGKIAVRNAPGAAKFQVDMMHAPCSAPPTSIFWFFGQCCPVTCCVTQILLRRKVLEYDMSKYQCCQGYFNCCCFKAGHCGEDKCPSLCLCLEATLCNSLAISASRIYAMDKYNLSSDPCDYRIIRISNCIQVLSCVCDILAIFVENLRNLAWLLDRISDLVYHTVSGCMTAQVAFEMDHQIAKGGGAYVGEVQTANPIQSKANTKH